MLSFFFKDIIYLFLEKGEGREKERERNINVWFPLMHPLLGTWPATQAYALHWGLNWRPLSSQANSAQSRATPARAHFLFYLFVASLFLDGPSKQFINLIYLFKEPAFGFIDFFCFCLFVCVCVYVCMF